MEAVPAPQHTLRDGHPLARVPLAPGGTPDRRAQSARLVGTDVGRCADLGPDAALHQYTGRRPGGGTVGRRRGRTGLLPDSGAAFAHAIWSGSAGAPFAPAFAPLHAR